MPGRHFKVPMVWVLHVYFLTASLYSSILCPPFRVSFACMIMPELVLILFRIHMCCEGFNCFRDEMQPSKYQGSVSQDETLIRVVKLDFSKWKRLSNQLNKIWQLKGFIGRDNLVPLRNSSKV